MGELTNKMSKSNFDEFKQLILEVERKRIADLEEIVFNPDDFAKAIGEVLDSAVHHTNNKKRLADKLYPVVEKSLYKSVQKNPESLADAIYPVMGPAIRKAINQAIKSLSDSVNHGVSSSLSSQGLKWRIQAILSGKSYGEIVLKNTLVYQVKEVYLIHTDTGLLLAHSTLEKDDEEKGDMVSAMLTAIRDFVGDSLNVSQSESLESIEVGDLIILIEKGPHASLACVVYGDPASSVREKMRLILEDIHKDFGPELKDFGGDTDAFSDAEDTMEPILETELANDNDGGSGKMKKILVIIALLIITIIGIRTYWSRQWNKVLRHIEENDGYILNEKRSGRKFKATVFYDPNILDFQNIKDSSKIANDKIIITGIPIKLFSTEAVISKLKSVTSADKDISVREENGVIHIAGMASQIRVNQLKYWLPFMAGAQQFNFDDLVSLEFVRVLEIQNIISKIIISFKENSIKLTEGQEYKIIRLNSLLAEFNDLLVVLQQNWKLEVFGSSSNVLDDYFNNRIDMQRAQYGVEKLIEVPFTRIFIEWKIVDRDEKIRISPQIKNVEMWNSIHFFASRIY